jgi:acyl-CoA dehydrogenase
MKDMLASTVERILSDLCPPSVVRAAEDGQWPAALWTQLEDAGLLDALTPEDAGGTGLGWRDIAPVLIACGRHACAVPLAETIAARALAASAQATLPDGPCALALFQVKTVDGRLQVSARDVAFAGHARWIVGTVSAAGQGTELLVLDRDEAQRDAVTRVAVDARLDLRWDDARPVLRAPLAGGNDALTVGAAVRACQIAGAMARATSMAMQYAGERIQFGKPISKFQALQQQLSVLGELSFAALMAAELACDAPGITLDPNRVAIGKTQTSDSAAQAAMIAHAVHGAIGVTREHDLQLFNRRLWAWRHDFGSDAWWSTQVGRAVLGDPQASAWDKIREYSNVSA